MTCCKVHKFPNEDPYKESPDKTLDDLGRNVKPVNDGSRASAGAHSVTASRRSISLQYRWAWCARSESVGHSKPATVSASVRERSDARGMGINDQSKEAALKCDKCGLIFPGDQCCSIWKHMQK